MLQLLRENSFTQEQLAHPARGYCKVFQRMDMMQICNRYQDSQNYCEIGPHDFFNILEACQGNRIVIDPYRDAGGAGLSAIPGNFPYPSTLFRCHIGQDSSIIPNEYIDFSFSVSVIEHVGQAEANYNCNPTDTPPDAQERCRDAFCAELFRITKRGGLTIHSVDHAARNLSFVLNFLKAGFEPLIPEDTVSVDECLFAPDAIRQRHEWLDPSMPMSDAEMTLHGVLTMGFKRPS